MLVFEIVVGNMDRAQSVCQQRNILTRRFQQQMVHIQAEPQSMVCGFQSRPPQLFAIRKGSSPQRAPHLTIFSQTSTSSAGKLQSSI
jgi:hypothetical protein